jgi:hypothetical protein
MANKTTRLGVRNKLRGAAQRRIQAVLPPAFRSHIKASIREAFLAFESLLDEAVKSLEKGERNKTAKRGKNIKVE